MLFRKISALIESHLKSGTQKILLVDGARQVGKTYIIRYVGQQLFPNFIELNMVEDSLGNGLFANTKTVEDFYLQVSMLAGDRMKERENTLIFIDEIQAYPHLLTLLKFLAQDGRFTYIASGSLLGVTLAETTSIPMGSIRKVRMFPLDFEEFLLANGMNDLVISSMRKKFERQEALDQAMHDKIMDLFRKYLLVGGLPDAVNSYLAEKNIQRVREIQREIHDYYAADASKYGDARKLQIRRVYDMIPSNMENKKKRVVAKDIEGKKGKSFADYQDEFEYLISAGIALHVQAVSNPVFPLIESAGKNLLKLYLNDVGILSGILYGNNIRAILDDVRSVNLGAVYETVAATELAAHGYRLFYYDNRSKGEVDYLVDDYDSLSVAPIEVKSGRDYTIHSALNSFVKNEDYHIKQGYVLSNEREVSVKRTTVHPPIPSVISSPHSYSDVASGRGPAQTGPALFSVRMRADHRPQHFLNFFPLPHGHGSFRPTLAFAGLATAVVISPSRLARSSSLGRFMASTPSRSSAASMAPEAMALRRFGPRDIERGTRCSGGRIAVISFGI